MGQLEDPEAEAAIGTILSDARPVNDKCHQTHAEHQIIKMAQKGANKTPSKSKTAMAVLKGLGGLDSDQAKMVHPALLEFAKSMTA